MPTSTPEARVVGVTGNIVSVESDAPLMKNSIAFVHTGDASLKGARLNGSELGGADFLGADVAGADFDGADVTSTRLTGMRGRDRARNLDRVKNLDRAFSD